MAFLIRWLALVSGDKLHEASMVTTTAPNKNFCFMMLGFKLNKKERRHLPYASRFTTNHHHIWGCLRPYGCSPNNDDLLFTCGGDCEAIERYVLEREYSIQLQR